VALARALINRPEILLADEPTSNLDDGNAERVLGLLREHARDHGAALAVASGVIAALLPAIQAYRIDISAVLARG
jgi:ABC-type ATPase involved in cell division